MAISTTEQIESYTNQASKTKRTYSDEQFTLCNLHLLWSPFIARTRTGPNFEYAALSKNMDLSKDLGLYKIIMTSDMGKPISAWMFGIPTSVIRLRNGVEFFLPGSVPKHETYIFAVHTEDKTLNI